MIMKQFFRCLRMLEEAFTWQHSLKIKPNPETSSMQYSSSEKYLFTSVEDLSACIFGFELCIAFQRPLKIPSSWLWTVNFLTYTSQLWEPDTASCDFEPWNKANFRGIASAVLSDLTNLNINQTEVQRVCLQLFPISQSEMEKKMIHQ